MNSRYYLTLNQHFKLKNRRNWQQQVWMLNFWNVINWVFVNWTKKLTIVRHVTTIDLYYFLINCKFVIFTWHGEGIELEDPLHYWSHQPIPGKVSWPLYILEFFYTSQFVDFRGPQYNIFVKKCYSNDKWVLALFLNFKVNNYEIIVNFFSYQP